MKEISEQDVTVEDASDVITPEAAKPPSDEDGFDISIVGSPHPEEMQIYLAETTLNNIKRHAASDTSRELGGVLIGKLCQYSDRRYINITGSIRARHTTASSDSITFTHDTWEDIHRQIEDKHPDKVILGWYHSHPRYGVFMSPRDIFIHQNFFNQGWHTALVVDPVQDELALFRLKEDEVVQCSGYYLYSQS